MSELVFVRHGQASFGTDSYDKLSEQGWDQVKILAAHWQQLGESFHHLYSGDLQRQRETASVLQHLVEERDSAATVDAALNEYNGDPLLRLYLRDFAEEAGIGPGTVFPIKNERLFQRLIEAATQKWIRGELTPQQEDTGFEHWRDFKQRVHSVVDSLMSRHTSGARVLVSTSGGVIATSLQRVLQFPDEQVIATNWMLHNSSVTRVKYGNGKMSLTLFNSLAHLERPGLTQKITYR
ncbi:MAG: histidine phosphatase family protein [Gammaproteobacteria bacterium]